MFGIKQNEPKTIPPIVVNHDFRADALNQFMSKHKFKKPYYTHEFLQCADKSGLDWRLLPAIEFAESSGGQHYIPSTNNPFGWDSDRSGFGSIPEGICFVDDKLAHGTYYKNKSIKDKLLAYNHNPAYGKEVIGLMNEIKN